MDDIQKITHTFKAGLNINNTEYAGPGTIGVVLNFAYRPQYSIILREFEYHFQLAENIPEMLTPEQNRMHMLASMKLSRKISVSIAQEYRLLVETYRVPLIIDCIHFGKYQPWMQSLMNIVGFSQTSKHVGSTIFNLLPLPENGELPYEMRYEKEMQRIKREITDPIYYETDEDRRWRSFDRKFLEQLNRGDS